MELTDGQFERLVGMLADNRAAISTVKAELLMALSESEKRIKTQVGLLHSAVDVLDVDLTRVQSALRKQGQQFERMEQSIVGLTELSKTNFDMQATILKRLHGEESDTITHGQTNESQRADPQ